MNRGFFSSSQLIQTGKPVPTIARCGLCGLYKQCQSPKMKPFGEGRMKILVVAEAPGSNEDKEGRPLIGISGMHLETTLKNIGVNMTRDCWRTNAVICHPKDNKTPDSDKIQACYPNLVKTINELKPNVIILLGGIAIESFIGPLWKEKLEGVNRWVGWCIPCQKVNAWVCPTYHPSYLKRMHDQTLDMFFKKHLHQAVLKAKNKPFDTVPDYRNEIETIFNPSKAAKAIKNITKQEGVIAFDYETNTLKPDPNYAQIVSCSVCHNGKRTIAFPWTLEPIEAMVELLKSDAKKIASNMKFEDRWTKSKLGFHIKHWFWDTMIAAHILDNRPNISSLKFQSLVLLGVEKYDLHIKPYLEAQYAERNRIKELDLKDLLIYNGLDSLLEYKVAMKQMKILNRRQTQ